MKKLILLAFLLPFSVQAAGKEILTDHDLSKQMISALKDTENEASLSKSSEFKKCYEMAKFDPKNPATPKQVADAETCFKEEIKNKKGKELEQLSDKLGLTSYGLISNKNIASITSYLSDKLYQSMTGINRKEQATDEALKFKYRKNIDQEVFIQMYMSHLTKRALQEISRYCFENLRNTTGPQTSFSEHWETFFKGKPSDPFPTTGINDEGDGKWTTAIEGDKEKKYAEIFKQVIGDPTRPMDPKRMDTFYNGCMATIKTFCDDFQKNIKSNPPPKTGANACLTKAKLQEIRKVLADSTKIEEQFKKDFTGGVAIGSNEGSPNFYDPNSKDGNSADMLTNISSDDFLSGGKVGKEDEFDKLAKDCEDHPENKKCDDFLVINDDRQKIEHKVDLDMRLKKIAEIERIKDLKKNDKKTLIEYLETNGYLGLAEQYKNGPEPDWDTEIGNIFDAKRVATIQAIQSKLGSRQVSEQEVKDNKIGKGGRDGLVEKSAKEAQQERARMAQVVLFNNIITSYIELSKPDGTTIGRNVNAWKTEQKALEEGKVDPSLFNGIKEGIKDEKGANGETITGLSLIDRLLGAPEKKTAKSP